MPQRFLVHPVPIVLNSDFRHIAVFFGAQSDSSACRYSLDRVRNQIGDDLGYLAERAVYTDLLSVLDQDVDFSVSYLAREQLQYIFEKVSCCSILRLLHALLRPPKRLLGDSGDALQLAFYRFDMLARDRVRFNPIIQQVQEVNDSLQWVVDLVCDNAGHSSCDG